jgi:hypothetical protein
VIGRGAYVGAGVLQCPRTGERYRHIGDVLEEVFS